MHKPTLTALALILAAAPALAQEAAPTGTEDLNAAALSALKNDAPENTEATPEVVEEIDAAIAEAEAVIDQIDAETEVEIETETDEPNVTPEAAAEIDAAMAEAEEMVEAVEAEDVAEAASDEEIIELEEAAEEIEEALEEAEEVLEEAAVEPAAAADIEAEADLAVESAPDEAAPVMESETENSADDADETSDPAAPEVNDPLIQEPVNGNVPMAPTTPVMRDGDEVVLQPIVNKVETAESESVDVEVKTTEAPVAATNAELEAALAERGGVLPDTVTAEMAEAEATTVEIEETVTVAEDGTEARETMVIMTDAEGNTTVTRNATATVAAMDMIESPEGATKVKVMVKKLEGEEDKVSIEASGANVSETVTPDGSTRIIRITPENGDKGTLITITKD